MLLCAFPCYFRGTLETVLALSDNLMGAGTTKEFAGSSGFLDTSAGCSRFWDAMLHIETIAGDGTTCLTANCCKCFFHQSLEVYRAEPWSR